MTGFINRIDGYKRIVAIVLLMSALVLNQYMQSFYVDQDRLPPQQMSAWLDFLNGLYLLLAAGGSALGSFGAVDGVRKARLLPRREPRRKARRKPSRKVRA